jgi:hypothetical protein
MIQISLYETEDLWHEEFKCSTLHTTAAIMVSCIRNGNLAVSISNLI